MSALRTDVAARNDIVTDKKKIWVTDVFGNSLPQNTATVKCWLPEEDSPIWVVMVVGPYPVNILGLDVLKGRGWEDSSGKEWKFGFPTTTSVRLLQMAPTLPPSKIVNVKPYPLPLGAREGISPVIKELQEQGVIIQTHSPYNSPVWPVRKPNGKWRLTIDYRRLNAGTGPLTAAVPNIAELVSTIQEQSHNILATIDVKDMFFMVPLQENDRGRFAFTWDGIQYTFTHLPQGYKHSPTLAHHALAQALAEAPPPEEGVRTYIDDVRVPENKKELQHALGLLVFWRKHIPDFSIIARPLYDLTRKRAAWDWTPVHKKALKLLVFEAGVYQALGPIHPTDPFQIEWGFAIHGPSIHIWQRGPEGPTRPLGFFSRSFKDAEKRYSAWEKGLFVVTLALQEVGKIIRKQSIILRGPFKVLRPVLAGTPPPMGVAQRETVRKWYAQLEHYSHAYQVEEGTPRILQIQDRSSVPLEKEAPPTYIREAPPYEPQLKNVWFTDASSKREGKVWKYRAVALCVDSGGQIITEGEGSAQVGELVAVWSVVTRGKDNTDPVYIYTDSYAVFKGCTEWLPFWEQNQWEVNWVP
ncbi:hypothetical protein QYF61_005500, partial [Mycteria americana]